MAPSTPPFSTPTLAECSADLTIPSHSSLRLDVDVSYSCQDEIRSKHLGSHRASPGPPCTTRSGVQPRHVPDWSNLNIIHRNVLPPRSHFVLYDAEDDALAANTGLARSLLLSGLWGFHLSESPFKGPQEFHKPSFDNSKWPLVKVPGMWSVPYCCFLRRRSKLFGAACCFP